MEKLARFKWAIVLAVIGVVLCGLAVASLFAIFRDTGTSFLVGGKATVTLSKPGDYTLWHETNPVIDGQLRTFPDDLPQGTTIKVLKLPEATVVPLRRGGASQSIEIRGRRRVSVGKLTIDRPGEYQLTVTGLEEKHLFYLQEAKFGKHFLRAIGFGLVGMLSLLAALGLGIYRLLSTRLPKHSTSHADKDSQTRQWAMFLHFSLLGGFVIPLAGLIAPILIWQLKKDELPGISAHGKVVVNWLISELLYGVVSLLLTVVLIGIPLLGVLGILGIIFPIVGGIKANNGQLWNYPLSIRFIKS